MEVSDKMVNCAGFSHRLDYLTSPGPMPPVWYLENYLDEASWLAYDVVLVVANLFAAVGVVAELQGSVIVAVAASEPRLRPTMPSHPQ